MTRSMSLIKITFLYTTIREGVKNIESVIMIIPGRGGGVGGW